MKKIEDQIAALAREYAEEMYPNLSDKIISLKTQEIKEAEGVIRFLLHRFCLVEKSKVAIKYKNAKRLEEDATAFGFEKHRSNAKAIKNLIESLFPEIEKEADI